MSMGEQCSQWKEQPVQRPWGMSRLVITFSEHWGGQCCCVISVWGEREERPGREWGPDFRGPCEPFSGPQLLLSVRWEPCECCFLLGGFSCCWFFFVCFFGGAGSSLLHKGSVPRGMWNHPRSGVEPMFPALAGRLLTNGPLGKSLIFFLIEEEIYIV